MRKLPAAAFLVALGVSLAAAGQQLRDGAVVRVEPEVPAATAAPKGAKQKGGHRATHRVPVALEAPSAEEVVQLETPRKAGIPQKIGFPRPIPALDGEEGTGRHLAWETLPEGGLVAAISVTSPEAAALRFGLRVREAPAAATFRFYDADGEEVFEVSGGEVLAAIAANVAAGETGSDARTYWSPIVESSTAVMEIELPSGSRPNDLRMSVPLVSHIVTTAKTDFLMPKAAASCNRDAMCQQGAWGTQMNAVARMVFSSGGFSYLCSGTLLADSDTSTTIPYFLSANHCINTQSTATSLNTYWFWRSTACNSGIRGPYLQQTGGATLLYHSTSTDVSFMQLNRAPPAGVTYAGWAAGAVVPMFSAVTGLHHPTGDLLKISGGTVMGYMTCTPPNSEGQFSCSTSTSANTATFYDVSWNSGVVEGGSSGSALFDGGKYVVGQLYGGSSSCADPAAGDSYGRFDVSYRNALNAWLSPAATPPQMLTVTKAGSAPGSVASTPSGIDCGATCSAVFPQDTMVTLVATPATALGATFAGWGGACGGTGTCSLPMNAARSVTATFNYAKVGTGVVSQSVSALVYGSAQASQTAAFTNDTGATVTFIQASTDSPRFGQTNDCGEVAHGASCTVTITYYPTNAGLDIATFTMTSTAPNSPHILSLSATPAPAATPPRLGNISARGQILTGNDVMIGGFVIGGSGSKTVVVRARGPSLVPFGITNALANPTLQLVRSSDQATIAVNDNWGSAPNAAQLSASGFAPTNPFESAILVTLPSGAYTAMVSGVAGATGVGMVEVFEMDHPEVPLSNISTRGQVRSGNEVLIGGFVVQGNGPQTVVIRARGPSLIPFGITNALANPMLQLMRSSDQALVASNDDWGTASNAASLIATGLAPSNPLEAALLVTLNPGAYTAIVSGSGGGTGVGIVEVFAQ